jgi:hypothetical protein
VGAPLRQRVAGLPPVLEPDRQAWDLSADPRASISQWPGGNATSSKGPSTPSPSRLPRPTSSSDEAKAAGGGDHPVTVHAKMLRLELLKVKADLERELEDFSLNCSKCGLDVHWVSGLGVSPGHWAHREPAPHGEPAV